MVASEIEGRVQKNCSWKASTDSNGSIWPKRSTLAQRKEAPMKPLTLPSEGGGSTRQSDLSASVWLVIHLLGRKSMTDLLYTNLSMSTSGMELKGMFPCLPVHLYGSKQ